MSFYITTAISYVNGAPHLGHAYEAIATDVIARHMRQRRADVFFLTGTDEHGEPIADAARAEGVEPQALADRHAARFIEMTKQLEISNDYFIRTTDPRHKEIVQDVLQRVHDAGHTY
ncbi:MAG: class I tRNA ligase family protein, partial [Solirubrobacteraceae bacterium]